MSVVAIVGRPNVGKSTLFNRLAGKRLAIVEGVPGVTRDRHYAEVDWGTRRFTLVDTGGLDWTGEDELQTRTADQARQAVAEADLILFVVDAHDGLLPADREIAEFLRTRARDVLVVANKVDGPRWEPAALEFHALGFDAVLPVSAEHRRGVDELAEALEERLPPPGPAPEAATDPLRLAVLGRPNVGKSSLVNRILGQERLVVSAAAGTTRDAIDTPVTFRGRPYVLIDTAGIRRRSRVEGGVERWSVLKAIRSIDRSHVCLVLVDAVEGLTDQDVRILNLVERGGRGAVLCLNKWDAVGKDEKTFDRLVRELKGQLGSLHYVPIVSLSALTGQRVTRVFDAADRVYGEWTKRVPTSEVNEVLRVALRDLAPPVVGRKRTRIYYMTQAETAPPVFAAFASYPEGIPTSYRRYLLNRVRQAFGFEGVPVSIQFRRRSRPGEP
ncbi:MAG: ribosome biogenesis GTPase Der [Deferrisomatales bacterium]